jgi:hypothetical protein
MMPDGSCHREDRRNVFSHGRTPSGMAIAQTAVRVIDVFVDELDLADLRFNGVDPEVTG